MSLAFMSEILLFLAWHGRAECRKVPPWALGYGAVLLGAFSLWMMAPGAALWEPEGCVSHGRGCALSGGCTWVQGAMPGQVVALTKGFGVWFPR